MIEENMAIRDLLGVRVRSMKPAESDRFEDLYGPEPGG
jgi:hypothetical protein